MPQALKQSPFAAKHWMCFLKVFFCLLFVFVADSCKSPKQKAGFDAKAVIPKENKTASSDPFSKHVVESQYFEISSDRDTVLEGAQGTTITIPRGSFITRDGKPATGTVRIELAEAITPDQALAANLTTYSNGLPLQNGGMIYLNAQSGSGALLINPDKPLFIEIPTTDKKPGMRAFEGQRDANGNMNWINPRPIETFLLPVDIYSLDFLPEGFASEVQKGMPFRSYSSATKVLTDSLYYSLSSRHAATEVTDSALHPTDYNEAYQNSYSKVVKGKYTKDSYTVRHGSKDTLKSLSDMLKVQQQNPSPCGIDPARIKVVHSNIFENTLIATKEFESRMPFIHQTCRNDILELYVNNLEKNLWEIDEMAALKLGTNKLAPRFLQFAALKQTRIKEGRKDAALLSNFYNKRLKQVNEELAGFKKKEIKERVVQDKEVEHIAEKYRNLLFKREKYRMEKYGFSWTQTGWVEVGKLAVWTERSLQASVEKGRDYDATYVYLVNASIESIYRLNTDDKEHFYIGDRNGKGIPCFDSDHQMLIVIAYKDEIPYIGIRELDPEKEVFLLTPELSSKEGIKKMLEPYTKNYLTENSIEKDLEFQAFFYKEQKRQEQLHREEEFLLKLWHKANPCCPEGDGEKIFKANCASCHFATGEKLTGPGLHGMTGQYTMDWLIRFTRNSSKMIKEGDSQALKAFNENGEAQMTSFPSLSDEEIRAIFKHVDGLSKTGQ
jgi:cytochrome c553